jgi:hypothetical protein
LYTASSEVLTLALPTLGTSAVLTVYFGFVQTGASVTISNSGNSYSVAPTITFSAPSTGIAATGHAVISGGGITSIIVDTPGYGYGNTTPTITINPTSGHGSPAAAVTSGHMTTGIGFVAITTAGTFYTSVPAVTVTGAGTGGTVTVSLGVVGAIVSGASGTNLYTVAPVLAVTGGGGSGATLEAVIAGPPGHLSSATVTAAGSGYTSEPTVSFLGGPIATPLTISSGGSGYTSATLVQFPGGNGAATAVAVIGSGIITAINVTNAGNWYTAGAAIISDSGGGTGAAATFTVPNPVQTGYVAAPWCTFDPADGDFYPGQNGTLVATVPTGATIAFAFPGGGLPALSNTTSPNCPAAIVLYTDWLQFLPGVDLSLSYEVAGIPPVRIAYQLNGTPTTPATVTVTGQTYTNGSVTVGGTAFASGYFGCAVIVGNDPQENEIVNATTLLRPYEGSSGTSAVVTPLVAVLLNAAAGTSTPYITDIGTQSGPFVRLKITQPSSNLQYRAIEAKATWTVFP